MRKILYYYKLGKTVYRMCHDVRLRNDADLGTEIRHEVRFRKN
jgi:hypothetical protein